MQLWEGRAKSEYRCGRVCLSMVQICHGCRFNTHLRGGSVSMHEYLQLGKGRDVGLQQITQFEAKLAQGNAEQARAYRPRLCGTHRADVNEAPCVSVAHA